MKQIKLMTFALLLTSFSSLAAVDVVVHPTNGASLSKTDITRIFLGKSKSFPSGGQAIPINQSESSAVTKEFNGTVLNKSNSQLKAYWSKLVFTGKGTPPKTVNSDAEVLGLIASNPSLIGFVKSGTADGNVKVIGTF